MIVIALCITWAVVMLILVLIALNNPDHFPISGEPAEMTVITVLWPLALASFFGIIVLVSLAEVVDSVYTKYIKHG